MKARIRRALSEAFNETVSERAILENLGGHASLRIYWRIQSPRLFKNDSSLIAMVLPEGKDALKSDEGGSSSDPIVEELPFVVVQRYLKKLGIRVPEIVYTNMDLGVLLLEDLGITMFENRVLNETDQIENLYREAIDLLADFQRKSMAEKDKRCVCWSKAFDAELLRWELDHYVEWGVDALHEHDYFEGIREAISEKFDTLVKELQSMPQALVLRDYQSRNIMWKENQWVMIDFQDALQGPYIYDLVALLRDSYIELPNAMVSRLVDYYASLDLPWNRSLDDIHRDFHLQTLQRKLKDTGRFIFIDRVKHNPDFLPYYEPSLNYVQHALSHSPMKDDPIWKRIVQHG